MSFGRRLRAARQRAARNKSAVESGPPETASITLASRSISANSLAASRAEIGAASAAGTLLFPLDALFEDHRGAGLFASATSRSPGYFFRKARKPSSASA